MDFQFTETQEAFLKEVRGLEPFVLWGPSEQLLAEEVAKASGGAARVAPATTTADSPIARGHPS